VVVAVVVVVVVVVCVCVGDIIAFITIIIPSIIE